MTTRIHEANVHYIAVDTLDDDGLAEFYPEPTAIEADSLALVITDSGCDEATLIHGNRQDLGDLCLAAYDTTCEQPWDNNYIQFARLLAEIVAVGGCDDEALCESMDLSIDDLNDLFERAQAEWERIKEGVT